MKGAAVAADETQDANERALQIVGRLDAVLDALAQNMAALQKAIVPPEADPTQEKVMDG
jgi:hypothetical protein